MCIPRRLACAWLARSRQHESRRPVSEASRNPRGRKEQIFYFFTTDERSEKQSTALPRLSCRIDDRVDTVHMHGSTFDVRHRAEHDLRRHDSVAAWRMGLTLPLRSDASPTSIPQHHGGTFACRATSPKVTFPRPPRKGDIVFAAHLQHISLATVAVSHSAHTPIVSLVDYCTRKKAVCTVGASR